MSRRFAWSSRLVLVVALGCSRVALAADAPPPEDVQVEWVKGPAQVDVGERLAEIKLPDGLAFAGAADARRLLEQMGNLTDGSEQGLIVPRAQDEDWFIVLEWNPIGFVKDDEKDDLNKDALLAGFKENEPAANERRKKQGYEPMYITGWETPPFYDAKTHNLTWALRFRGEQGGNEARHTINHEVRLLGRYGTMSAVLVAAPDQLQAAVGELGPLLSGFSFKAGNTYGEYRQGDKLAAYGLTGLVLGGGLLAAAKTGLLAQLGKYLKVIVFGAIAVVVGAWKAIKARFGHRD